MVQYIVHDEPVAAVEENRIVQVDLAPYGFDGMSEQLWLQHSEGVHRVGCIPFRVYGMALYDEVAVTADDAIAEIVGPSGHDVFRVFLLPAVARGLDRTCMELSAAAEDLGLLHEWSGPQHIAVDVPPGESVDALRELLAEDLENEQAFCEFSSVKPFVGAGALRRVNRPRPRG